jgi:signal transduction histidine kinase
MNSFGLIESQHLESAPLSTLSAVFGQHPGPVSGFGSDTVAALAHDARNLITALGLYCDLLDEPGVLAPPFAHYRGEMRLVMAAGHRLVSKLVAQSERESAASTAVLPDFADTPWLFPVAEIEALGPVPVASTRLTRQRPSHARFDDEFTATPVTNLAVELLSSRNLLAALAGPGIAVTVEAEGGARGIQLTAEDLTRILVNLVRNAADAMPSGGCIHIGLTEMSPDGQPAAAGAPTRLLLAFEDNGPGIPSQIVDRVFDHGFTTRTPGGAGENWTNFHRGLGLAIARSIVESACGRIEVTNRPEGGARFLIELPAL